VKPESRYIDVLGSRMHYVEMGQGDPIVFLHGNPTSSYLWRNVAPPAAEHGRTIALDLIGMGDSDKPDIDYTFTDHLAYATAALDALDLGSFSVVVHDWGGPLGLTYALNNLERVKAITVMETILMPMNTADLRGPARLLFGLFRTSAGGYLINQVLNVFVKALLPRAGHPDQRLAPEHRRVYESAYPTVASRKPVAQWPRELPFSADQDSWSAVERIRTELRSVGRPVLLIHADPGAIVNEANIDKILATLPLDVEKVDVGPGLHYIQEAQPDKVGEALADFLSRHHA
jgi:haloalkane dehalogenase